jgi:hypothetical protein
MESFDVEGFLIIGRRELWQTDRPMTLSLLAQELGGGSLAANLALAGHKVLLIEAGGERINDNYSIPAFHALATEDPQFS